MRLKKVKAGVLLYALLMASIFTLILQFYLNRVVAAEQQHQAQISQSQARLMAELTKEMANEASGSFNFNGGTSTFETKDNQMTISVQLGADIYRYSYFVKKQEEEKEEEEEKDGKGEIESLSKDEHPTGFLEDLTKKESPVSEKEETQGEGEES